MKNRKLIRANETSLLYLKEVVDDETNVDEYLECLRIHVMFYTKCSVV
jgi:hypothetical protein